MSSSNVNQILSRNINILTANTPLFINIKHNDFIHEYLTRYPATQLSCYNTHFEDYLLFKQHKQIDSFFSAQYQTEKTHDLIIIAFPKSKAELNFTLTMIAHAANESSTIIVVGENKSGIKSIDKVANKTLINCQKIDSARHCLLYVAKLSSNLPSFKLEDWYEYYDVTINDISLKVATLPGVFSQKSLDKGTRILLEHIPNIKPGKLLDFGCGAGVIASYIGKKHPDISLNLLDVSALAIQSSRKTLEINNLTGDVFASNSLSELKNKYDVVVSNPPFHQGIAINYQATESFLCNIKKHLCDKAHIYIVANSFLKYEPLMKKNMNNTSRLLTQQGFTIYQCIT